jgi:glycerol-3-phosphate dehydrogenase (NAD(P)+)
MTTWDLPALRIAVIGAGSWGTTLAALAAHGAGEDAGATVLWAREPEVVDTVNRSHTNPRFLPDYRLPPTLRATASLADALAGADAVIMAVPSQHFRSVFREVAPLLPPAGPVLSVVKGIERGSLLRMTEVIDEESGHDPALVGVLSGPNVAREVAAGQPAATVIALRDPLWAPLLQARFMSPSFRVYTNPDVVGCEIAGAVKNVIAIAAGIADGLGFGANTKAALLTRGLAEMARLGTAIGGQPLTFLGLAGNGDLVATCCSDNSRNHRVGVELGRGHPIEEIVRDMHMIAEGVDTTPGVLALAAEAGVEMPIAAEVHAVLQRRRTPREAVDVLMGREARPELDVRVPTREHAAARS